MKPTVDDLLRQEGVRTRAVPVHAPDLSSFLDQAESHRTRWLAPASAGVLVALVVCGTVLGLRLASHNASSHTTTALSKVKPTASAVGSPLSKGVQPTLPSGPPPSALVGPDPRGAIDPYVAKFMKATNDWGLSCGGMNYYFVAGSTLDTNVGEVYASGVDTAATDSTGPLFVQAPGVSGPLRIATATCDGVELSATDGTTLTYNLITHVIK